MPSSKHVTLHLRHANISNVYVYNVQTNAKREMKVTSSLINCGFLLFYYKRRGLVSECTCASFNKINKVCVCVSKSERKLKMYIWENGLLV